MKKQAARIHPPPELVPSPISTIPGKESEHFFRAIFEQAAIGVAQVDTMTGRFLRVNQHYCDILGYTRAEMTHLTLQEITYQYDLQENLDYLKRLQAGVIRDFAIEKRYLRKDGSIVWVNLTVSPMWEAGETPNYHIAVVEDITQRKKIETDLLKFSRAVEQSVSSVLITDAHGRIEFVNPTFTRLSGYSADEVLGKNPSISKSGKTSAQEYEKMWQIITSGKEWKGELRNRTKDGQLYWVSASISPIRDAAGAITHFLAIQEDITERKRLEQQLFRQNNYLSALHEISLGILGHLDVNELLQDLVTRACQVLQAQNGCIYLVNKSLDQLECMFGVGILNNYVGICFKPGEGIAGKVWMTARPLIIEDYPSWEGRSSQIGSKDVRSVIGIPLVSGSQAIGVLILAYGLDSERVFSADEVALLERLANLASISIENARLFDETQRLFKTEQQRAAELAIMVKASETMAKNIGLQELSRVVGDMVTEIFTTDATSILLLDAQNQVIQPLYEFDEGQYIENLQPFPLGQGLTSRVIRTRQPLLIGTAQEAAQHGAYYPPEAQAHNPSVTQSYLGVPIQVGDQVLGVLAIHSYSQNAFDQNQARLLSALSGTIGSAIENARLYSEMEKARQEAEAANQKMSHELTLAGEIQRSFLPLELPALDGWDVAAQLHPARETSGDFYDFRLRPDQNVELLIADVVDKGVTAALMMAFSWSIFRTYADKYPEKPNQVIHAVNHRIIQDTHQATQFLTVFYAVLNPVSGKLIYCNAGHPHPLLFRDGEHQTIQQPGKTGMPLGLFEHNNWEPGEAQLLPGDVLILYTDGVVEAQNSAGEFFSEAGLVQSAQSHLDEPAERIASAIVEELHLFMDGKAIADDVALMVLRYM